MTSKLIKRLPVDEGARHLTDSELRMKLNDLIDQCNAQLEDIVYLRGQINLLNAQVTALRRR